MNKGQQMEAPPLWPSYRLVYTMCAFSSLVFQLCMRNCLSLAILCMVKPSSNAHGRNLSRNALEEQSYCNLVTLEDQEENAKYPPGEIPWTNSQQLMLLSSFYYGYFMTQSLGGRLCDKFGGKFFFLAGLCGQSIPFMLIPLFSEMHYWGAYAMRLIQGMVAGIGFPAVYQMYSHWAHPKERITLMSFAFGGYSVGSLFVFPLTSFLCQFGWPTVYYTFGGVSCAFGIACYWLVYSTIDKHPRISPEEYEYLKESHLIKAKIPPIPWRQMLSSCPIITFMFTHICHSYGLITLVLILPKFFKEAMYFNLSDNGFYSSAPFVGSLTARFIVMMTFRRLHEKSNLSLSTFRRIVYSSANCVTASSIMGITFLTCHYRLFVVLLIVLTGASIDVAFTGAYWISYLDLAPAFAGLLAGISNSLATLSGIAAPHFVSAILKEGIKAEWNFVFYSMAMGYALSSLVYGIFGRSTPLPWGQFEAITTAESS